MIHDVIINNWFTDNDKFQKWWFQGKTNIKSREHIQNILYKYNFEKEINWKENKQNCISGILLYDQYYRHIQQNNEYHEKNAVELVLYGIQKEWIPNEPHLLTFFFMPFRHTNNKYLVDYCKKFIEYKQLSDNSIYYNKFLNALSKTYNTKINKFISDKNNWLNYYTDYKDILCNEIEYEYEKNEMWIFNSNAWKCFINYIKNRDINKTLIISLSGGVDSMVFLYLCLLYRIENPLFKFTAIHINWNQRTESEKEANFLIEYMKNNEIPYLYKNINHLKRSNNRELFEKEGKKIRFTIYQEVIEKWNGDSIFLGHHKGDIVENVFTNMIYSKNITNLGKMKENMEINNSDIVLVRPFLKINKSDIYEVAKKNLIPFLKNTTPEWSNRGAIRKKIFPQIENHFGKRYEDGFMNMAKKSEELGILVNDYIINPYLDKIIKINENTYSFPYITKYPFVFYEIVFEKFMYSKDKQKIKTKALKSWYEIIKRNKEWKSFTFNPNCKIYVKDENTLFLEINI